MTTPERKFHFEARPSSGKDAPFRTWKLVRVLDPCPTCGAGEPQIQMLAFAYMALSEAEQASIMTSIADALNKRVEENLAQENTP